MSRLAVKTAAGRYWKVLLSALIGKKVKGPKYITVKGVTTKEIANGITKYKLERFVKNSQHLDYVNIGKERSGTVVIWKCTLGEIRIVIKFNENGAYIAKYRTPLLLHRLILTKYSTPSELILNLLFDSETTLERIVEDNAINSLVYRVLQILLIGTVVAVSYPYVT